MKFLKKNYKFFLLSLVIWFLVITTWNFLETKYNIQDLFLKKLSQEFILTTVLGIITTVLGGLYAIYKERFHINSQEIQKNREILHNNNNMTIEMVRKLEDMIDSNTFELRRLDDFKLSLAEIQLAITNQKIDTNNAVNAISKQLKLLEEEQIRQKEYFKHNERLTWLNEVLIQDIKERQTLKIELEKVLTELSEKTEQKQDS